MNKIMSSSQYNKIALIFASISLIAIPSTNALGSQLSLMQNLDNVDKAVRAMSTFKPSIRDMEIWNEVNGENVPQTEKDLLSYYLAYYASVISSAQPNNLVFRNLMSDTKGWQKFVGCVASNPIRKKNINMYDAGYGSINSQEAFYFLYPKSNPNGWGVDFKKVDTIRDNFKALTQKFKKHSEYMNERMYEYHPLILAKDAYDARVQACINRFGEVMKQLYKSEEFQADPLNQAKGASYNFTFDETPAIAYKMMPGFLNRKDYTDDIYNYSLKKATKVDVGPSKKNKHKN